MSPFVPAAEHDWVDILQYLLELDHMDLTTLPTDYDEQAMLICAAAASGSEALVERLLKHGCDPKATIKTCGDLD